VGYRGITKTLGYEGRMAEQHRKVVAVAQIFEGLCGVFNRKLGDGGF